MHLKFDVDSGLRVGDSCQRLDSDPRALAFRVKFPGRRTPALIDSKLKAHKQAEGPLSKSRAGRSRANLALALSRSRCQWILQLGHCRRCPEHDRPNR